MFSHSTYCSPMNDMAVVLSDKLQGSQNHCYRFVYMIMAVILHQFTLNLKSTNKLTEQISKFFHVLVLKLQTGQPKYFSEIYFSVLGKCKNFSHCFVHATHRTNWFRKSFIVTACRLWNSLPLLLRSIEDTGFDLWRHWNSVLGSGYSWLVWFRWFMRSSHCSQWCK